MPSIAQSTLDAWRRGRKTHTTSKGWVSGNAVCCPHNGESADKRGRGAVIVQGDGVSYHCFNCGFKTGYVSGAPLGYKFRKLLGWMGVDEGDILRLNFEALTERDRQIRLGIIKPDEPKEEIKVSFKKYPLPAEAMSFLSIIEFYELKGSTYPAGVCDAVQYLAKRKIDLQKYEFYWTEKKEGPKRMDKRVIVPFTWKGDIVGYSARGFDDSVQPKYLTQIDDGYVFNMDAQKKDWKFVIVSEGVFDALSVDGVAILKSDITKQQIDLIESLDREIIVVPDWNKSGEKLIDTALQNQWAVSFPVWAETCSDISQAVEKYGKLFVIKTILDSVERTTLKIQLKRKLK